MSDLCYLGKLDFIHEIDLRSVLVKLCVLYILICKGFYQIIPGILPFASNASITKVKDWSKINMSSYTRLIFPANPKKCTGQMPQEIPCE